MIVYTLSFDIFNTYLKVGLDYILTLFYKEDHNHLVVEPSSLKLAWMRIAQSLTLLLLEPVITWVPFSLFKEKVVVRALRGFPQFECVASNL